MATRIVEWDDFTGGYYVGPSATKQPRNTFTGDNVTVAMDDATLVPMYGPVVANLTGTTDVTSGKITNNDWTAVGPPAQLNGLICFVAKTTSAAYLYVVTAGSGGGTVVRHTITLSGILGSFLCLRPVMVIGDSKNDYVDVFIPGDYRQIHKYKLDNTGANVAGSPTTISLSLLMTATSDDRLYGLAVWGARMIGWSNTSYLYFSKADTFGTWEPDYFISVGYNEDRISVCVPRNYDLLVGKPSGWYVVTGVLSYSTAVRQINNGMGILANDGVAEYNNQVVYNTDTGTLGFPVNLYTVNGARVQPMMFQRFAGNIQNVNLAKGPLGILQVALTNDDDTDVNGQLYYLNQQGRWARINIGNGTGAGTGDTVYYYPTAVTQSRTAYWSDPSMRIMEHNQTDKKVAIHTIRIPTFEPGTDSAGNPQSATLLLADYMSQVPITCTDVYVEVELVDLYGAYAYGGDADISCRINMKYPPADLPFTVGNVSSTLMNGGNYSGSGIPGTGTRFMGRVFRFRPDNSGYGYGFEVQVTFSGMKLRRVMAILKESS